MPTTNAIVIRLTRLTDTSVIVHWFTQDHGLVKTVAKGARQPKSPFQGKLDLFFGGEVSFVRARQSDLHPLREVVIHDWREGLRQNYTTTSLAAYFGELLEAAVEPEHAEPDLYDLLRRALDHLAVAPPSMKALRHFENELARFLGVTDRRRAANHALEDSLGALPRSRAPLIERLDPPADFDSSATRYPR